MSNRETCEQCSTAIRGILEELDCVVCEDGDLATIQEKHASIQVLIQHANTLAAYYLAMKQEKEREATNAQINP